MQVLHNVSVDEFTTIDAEKEGFITKKYDLSSMLDYLNHPFNAKKLRLLTSIEKELIYYSEKISGKDQRTIVELCKIMSREGSRSE